MKVAVIKLGSRISFNAKDTSGGNGEARSIIKMLHGGGAEVHIFTKILKKDNLLPQYKWHNLEDVKFFDAGGDKDPLYQMDALVVLNGNVNFFGGAEDRAQLLNYKLINWCNAPVYYIYCDPELTLKQVWPSVSKKPWGSKWDEEDLNITRDDIIYLSQPHDVDLVRRDLKKNEVIPKKIIHYPFEKFPCLNDQLPINPKPEVDLSYGGTMRGGKRIKKMVEFYFDHPTEISVEMFGKIEAEDFDDHFNSLKRFSFYTPEIYPIFTGPIRYDEMLPKMNKAMAHCVIGDPYYEEINDMAQRAYESIWSNVVTFIDHDLDQLRRVYGSNKNIADFLYVQSGEELSEKILLLKTDDAMRRQILEEQLQTINFNPDQYCADFVEMLRDRN